MVERKGFRDRRASARPGRPGGAATAAPPTMRTDRTYWLYGRHAVAAALRNPRRRLSRFVYLADSRADLAPLIDLARRRSAGAIEAEPMDRAGLDRLLPGTVHQGVALRAEPLPEVDLDAFCRSLPAGNAIVLLLDQVTDPHNVGAILRSAAAFGAAAVALTERNAAPEGGTLAKAASGALDLVPLIRVANLARAIETLKAAGFWCIGLAEDAAQDLAGADLSGRVAFALGSEGEGLRRLTRERCDLIVRLPTKGALASLNVSNAAAVALYEASRRRELPATPPDA